MRLQGKPRNKPKSVLFAVLVQLNQEPKYTHIRGVVRKYPDFYLVVENHSTLFKSSVLQIIFELRLCTFANFVGAFVFPLLNMKQAYVSDTVKSPWFRISFQKADFVVLEISHVGTWSVQTLDAFFSFFSDTFQKYLGIVLGGDSLSFWHEISKYHSLRIQQTSLYQPKKMV